MANNNKEIYKCLGLVSTLKTMQEKLENGTLKQDELKDMVDAISEISDEKEKDKENYSKFFDINNNMFDYEKHLEKPSEILETGIKSFDNLLGGGLCSGLTLLCAPSSMGQTTLLLNIVVNIILKHKKHILYYSLEMSKDKLVDKIISYLCYTLSNCKDKISDREVEQSNYNEYTDIVKKTKEYYFENIAPYLHIITLDTLPTIDIIESIYMTFKENNISCETDEDKQKPIIVIDYLQNIKNKDARMTDKQQVDYTATKILEMTMANKLTTICISSLNRDSYREPKLLNISCLKDSGNLEYSAENVIVLQFRKIREMLKNNTIKHFDDEMEKRKEERELELTAFKVRYGEIGHSNINYNAKCNTFLSCEENTKTNKNRLMERNMF